MLLDNGRIPKERRNYFMSLDELGKMLYVVRKFYDSKWFLFNVQQYGMGWRSSEASATNIKDYSDNFRYVNYRSAKTNEVIYNAPVPEPVRKLLIAYIYFNKHRMIDGYIYANHGRKHKGLPIYSTEYICEMWHKWRKKCASVYNSDKWLDKYEIMTQKYLILSEISKSIELDIIAKKFNKSRKNFMNTLRNYRQRGFVNIFNNLTTKGKNYIQTPKYHYRHRIGSHSLRRLHRITLASKIKNDWIIAKLCHYKDMNAYYRYKNEFEVLEHAESYINPVINPVINSLQNISNGQQMLQRYTSL